MVSENVHKLLERVEKACQSSGRKKEEIEIVAVTKNVAPEKITEAIGCGIKNVGENRVQEAQDKFGPLHRSFPEVQWHMLGHLQKNKVNRALEIFDMVQSVDSLKLLSVIARRAGELGKIQDYLIEIKISEEPSKSGLSPQELKSFLESSSGLKNVRLRGVMAIAPNFEDKQNFLERPNNCLNEGVQWAEYRK